MALNGNLKSENIAMEEKLANCHNSGKYCDSLSFKSTYKCLEMRTSSNVITISVRTSFSFEIIGESYFSHMSKSPQT